MKKSLKVLSDWDLMKQRTALAKESGKLLEREALIKHLRLNMNAHNFPVRFINKLIKSIEEENHLTSPPYTPCLSCNGLGWFDTGTASNTIQVECEICNGSGSIIEDDLRSEKV